MNYSAEITIQYGNSDENRVSFWSTWTVGLLLLGAISIIPVHIISFWTKQEPLQSGLLRSLYLGIPSFPENMVAFHICLFFVFRQVISLVIIFMRSKNFYLNTLSVLLLIGLHMLYYI